MKHDRLLGTGCCPCRHGVRHDRGRRPCAHHRGGVQHPGLAALHRLHPADEPGGLGLSLRCSSRRRSTRPTRSTLAQYKALFWPMFLDRCWGRLMAWCFCSPSPFSAAGGGSRAELALWTGLIFLCGRGAGGLWLVHGADRPASRRDLPAARLGGAASALRHADSARSCSGRGLLCATLSPRGDGHGASARLRRPPVWCWSGSPWGLARWWPPPARCSVFNSFPTMDGQWLPPGMFGQSPVWTNFITNKGTVQFCHRLLATLTALTALTTAVMGLRMQLPPGLRDLFSAARRAGGVAISARHGHPCAGK